MTLTALPTMESESPLLYDGVDGSKDAHVWRSVSFLAGCAICLVSALNVLNLFSVLQPSLYLLNATLGFFGFALVVAEGDDYQSLEPYSNIIDTYFRFLNTNKGKAGYLLFISLLSFILTSLSVLYFPLSIACAGIATVLLVGKTKGHGTSSNGSLASEYPSVS